MSSKYLMWLHVLYVNVFSCFVCFRHKIVPKFIEPKFLKALDGHWYEYTIETCLSHWGTLTLSSWDVHSSNMVLRQHKATVLSTTQCYDNFETLYVSVDGPVLGHFINRIQSESCKWSQCTISICYSQGKTMLWSHHTV